MGLRRQVNRDQYGRRKIPWHLLCKKQKGFYAAGGRTNGEDISSTHIHSPGMISTGNNRLGANVPSLGGQFTDFSGLLGLLAQALRSSDSQNRGRAMRETKSGQPGTNG